MWTGAWWTAGVAATTTLGWMYATTRWAIALVEQGSDVINTAGAAVSKLVYEVGHAGEEVVQTMTMQFGRLTLRACDLTNLAMTVVAILCVARGALKLAEDIGQMRVRPRAVADTAVPEALEVVT